MEKEVHLGLIEGDGKEAVIDKIFHLLKKDQWEEKEKFLKRVDIELSGIGDRPLRIVGTGPLGDYTSI